MTTDCFQNQKEFAWKEIFFDSDLSITKITKTINVILLQQKITLHKVETYIDELYNTFEQCRYASSRITAPIGSCACITYECPVSFAFWGFIYLLRPVRVVYGVSKTLYMGHTADLLALRQNKRVLGRAYTRTHKFVDVVRVIYNRDIYN